MNDIINGIINAFDSIHAFFRGIMNWFDSMSMQFSYFKYIWSLRAKNFIVMLIVLLVFVVIIWIVKKVAFSLVDEHYETDSSYMPKDVTAAYRESLKDNDNESENQYEEENVETVEEEEIAETKPKFFDQFKDMNEDNDDDDELWYLNSKYRKSGRS